MDSDQVVPEALPTPATPSTDKWQAILESYVKRHLASVFATTMKMMIADPDEVAQAGPEVFDVVKSIIHSSFKLHDLVNGYKAGFSADILGLSSCEVKLLPVDLKTELVGEINGTEFHMSDTAPGVLFVRTPETIPDQ